MNKNLTNLINNLKAPQVKLLDDSQLFYILNFHFKRKTGPVVQSTRDLYDKLLQNLLNSKEANGKSLSVNKYTKSSHVDVENKEEIIPQKKARRKSRRIKRKSTACTCELPYKLRKMQEPIALFTSRYINENL